MKTFKQFFVGLMLVGMLSGHVSAAISIDALIGIAQNLSARIQVDAACLTQEEISFLSKDQTLVEQFNEIAEGDWQAVHALLQARVTSLLQGSVQVFASEKEEEEADLEEVGFNGLLPLWTLLSNPQFVFENEDMTDVPALTYSSPEEEADVPASSSSSSSSNSLPFVPQLEDFASDDAYELLSVARGDALDVINKRVRNLLRRYHPDKNAQEYGFICNEITKRILNAHKLVVADTMERIAAGSAAPSSSSSSSSQQSEGGFSFVPPFAALASLGTTTVATYESVRQSIPLIARWAAERSAPLFVAAETARLESQIPGYVPAAAAVGVGVVVAGIAYKLSKKFSKKRKEQDSCQPEAKRPRQHGPEDDDKDGKKEDVNAGQWARFFNFRSNLCRK